MLGNRTFVLHFETPNRLKGEKKIFNIQFSMIIWEYWGNEIGFFK